MQSPTREEMMKLQMYDTVVYVQEKNDASYKCMMQLQMYKKIMWLKGVVKLKYVPTKEQVADVLTKPLARVKFEYFRDKLGVVQEDLSRKRE